MNFNENSKNRNRKKRKIDFSFDSALCVSFMKVGAKLRGGVSAYPYLGQGLSFYCINVKTIGKYKNVKEINSKKIQVQVMSFSYIL